MSDKKNLCSTSRRNFLCGTAVAFSAFAVSGLAVPRAAHLPNVPGRAARWQRRNLLAPDFPAEMLDTYRLAVSRLLALPPSDPRNWYRLGLVHLLDCPHANGWFLPWHRGYLGWFERICREVTGRSDFALPYWDWTASPVLPRPFFEGVLDPAGKAFFMTSEAFAAAFHAPMQAYWSSLTSLQREQLYQRGYETFDSLWDSVVEKTERLGERARQLSATAPELGESVRNAVSLETLVSAFAPRTFAKFGGEISSQHSESKKISLLESSPHNQVHTGIGGLMGEFLSPFDPIFWLHHANIDRLWADWMQLQSEEALPIVPEGDALRVWQDEPFAFFTDERGRPVEGYGSLDYTRADMFEYEFEPGTRVPPRLPPLRLGDSYIPGIVRQADLSTEVPAILSLNVPADLLLGVLQGGALNASLHVSDAHAASKWAFDLEVVASNGEAVEWAGRFEVFGTHGLGHHGATLNFTLSLAKAIRKLHASGSLDLQSALSLRLKLAPRNSEVVARVTNASTRAKLQVMSFGADIF